MLLVLGMEILRFPLVRFCGLFVPGIICGYCFRPDIGLALAISASFAVLLGAGYLVARKRRNPVPFGVLFYAFAFCTGMSTQSVHAYYNERGHYYNSLEKKHTATVRLAERLKNSANRSRYIAEVTQIDNQASHGKILLHFKSGEKFPIGTKLIASSPIIKNKPPLNPARFDYGRYLNDKSIPAQCYLDTQNYKIIGVSKNFFYYADRLRTKMIEALRMSHFREPELQVLHALILGQQQEISRETIKDYQFAGAVHILSVSGLHVGFVMLFINFLLQKLPKTRRWNAVRLSCVVLSLWGFALVAGLAPSVVRSATMFSFVAIGMNLRRSTNTYHTLIVSLLLILIFEPAFIFDVGFQLSYAALFFIIWLQPLFAGIWKPQNRIVNYFWEIVTVSFAAQIGTLPISLYYFHQFPALFFVTNVIVIPMLSLIMALGIIVILPAALGYVIPFLTDALEWSIAALNRVIGFIASFDQFVLTEIPCNTLIAATCYLAIICLTIWLKKPSPRRLFSAALSVLILQCAIIGSNWHYQRHSEFVIFNVPRKTILVDRHGKSIQVYGSSQFIKGFAVARFANRIDSASTRHTYWFGGKKILLVDQDIEIARFKPGIIVLSQSPKINLDRWLAESNPELVVADASNFKSDVVRWKATCTKRKIPFHYTNEKGFFRLSD